MGVCGGSFLFVFGFFSQVKSWIVPMWFQELPHGRAVSQLPTYFLAYASRLEDGCPSSLWEKPAFENQSRKNFSC